MIKRVRKCSWFAGIGLAACLILLSTAVCAMEFNIPYLTGGDSGWTNELIVTNMGDKTGDFKVVLYNTAGDKVLDRKFTTPTQETMTIDLKNYTSDAQCGRIITMNTGNHASATAVSLVFQLRYVSPAGGIAEFALTETNNSQLSFNFNESNENEWQWKGLAVMNTDPETAAKVSFYAIYDGGKLSQPKEVVINPNCNEVGTPAKWFPAISADRIQSIIVSSVNGSLSGICISGNSDNTKLLFTQATGINTCKEPKPVKSEYMVKSPAGPSIYVVRKAPSQQKPTKVVLLIPWVKSGSTVYNLPIKGYNLMDYLVAKGFVAYAVDHRSYGESTKTSGLDVNGDNCGQDMKAVADFIEAKENVDKVNVVGLSFGTVVSVSLAANYPEEVERMVLMGLPYEKVNEKSQAVVDKLAHMAETGTTFIPSNPVTAKGLWYKYDENVLQKFVDIVEKRTPEIPTGPFIDARDARHAKYIPMIKCPTLFMYGEYEVFADLEDAMNCFKDCGAEKKAYMLMGNASHGLVLEKNHDLVFRTIYGWLTN